MNLACEIPWKSSLRPESMIEQTTRVLYVIIRDGFEATEYCPEVGKGAVSLVRRSVPYG